ncbi:tail length tape measure protein, partial [Escherichia coli]|nr:tail length tape measure protein [Escherichia coli]
PRGGENPPAHGGTEPENARGTGAGHGSGGGSG